MESKYDRIGKGYNLTRSADSFLLDRLHHHLNPKAGQVFLDIGCGSGNYTQRLHEKGLRLVGVDPSEHMLELARTANSDIDWRQGTAESLPLRKNEVDGAVGFLTTHHWENLPQGFAELARVCNPGGRIVLFTSTPAQMEHYWLNHYFPTMMTDSMQQMPKFEDVQTALQTAGFTIEQSEPYFVQNDLQDLFLYAGKERPELYLDPQVRQGISSFSALANQDEVREGLAQLDADLKAGSFQAIAKRYDGTNGDYLFMVAKNEN